MTLVERKHAEHPNIQPVYPLHLNPSWNLITRPILPVISQPPFFSGRELAALEEVFGPGIGDTEFGLGDLTPEFFFSPRKPIQLAPGASLVWGLGPALQFPTATDDELGTGKWSAGPGFVVFLSDGPIGIPKRVFDIDGPRSMDAFRGLLRARIA